MRGDHASQSYSTEDPSYRGVTRIFAVAVGPRDPPSIILAVGGRDGKWVLQ